MYGIVAVETGPQPDDQTQPTFEMTPGSKPFTRNIKLRCRLRVARVWGAITAKIKLSLLW